MNSFQNFVFIHEIGHFFGGQHQYLNNQSGDCAFGHQIYIETGDFSGYFKQSIMRPSGDRIPYYSNPDIDYQGQPTGVYDDYQTGRSHNNAGRINETGCIISNFTPSNNIYPFIQVSEENCLLNLTAIVEPTNPFYSYSWKWSLDGFFNDSYPGQQLGVGSGQSISTEQPIQQPCEVYFIQLTVSLNTPNSTNIVATEVISKKGDICTDNVQDCDETIGLIQRKDSNLIFQTVVESKTLDSKLLDIKEYYLFDVYGRFIVSKSSIKEIEYSLKTLPIGIYLISKKSKNGVVKAKKIFNNNLK